VFAASLALYILLVSKNPNASTSEQLRIKIAITILPLAVSAVYLAYPDPLLHQVCYAAIMITSVILVQQDYRAPQVTPAMVRQAKALNVAGTCTFLAGFLVWNLDNMYCQNLTAWRRDIGEYFGGLIQGHAWWHILTGLGASKIGTGITYLMLSKQYPGHFEVAYTFWLIPYVRRAAGAPSSTEANGKVNGSISRKRQ